MNSERVPLYCATAVLVASLCAAGLTASSVQRQRRELQLVIPAAGMDTMPPHVAVVSAALGTFRGLAIDLLWARADFLQTNGEYFEAQTLSQWITALQPRFQKVWAFQAWNLAWNISVTTQVPTERWGWIRRAIDLLRLQGIPLNPTAPQLQMELAWIFHGKIGPSTDAQHWYYKARLARDMQECLGDLTSGRTSADAVKRFRRIAEAPATIDDLLAAAPRVQAALDLLARHGEKPDEQLLRMLGRALMYSSSIDGRIVGTESVPEGTNRALVNAFRDDRKTAAVLFDDLIPHLQKRVLLDRYAMDPTKMLEAMERYGPLDWRHPKSHGIYWTEQGFALSKALKRRETVNELTLVRTRLHMINEMMVSGRVEFDAVTNRIDLLPDPRFARAYEAAIREAFAAIDSPEGVSAAEFGAAEEADLTSGYERFLNSATLLTFLYGDRRQATEYFQTLKELATARGEGDHPAFASDVETFVALRVAGLMNVDLGDLREFIDAMIRRAVMEGLARGDLGVFNRYLEAAHRVYDRRYSASDPKAQFTKEQAKLLEFPKLVENSFESIMKQQSLPVLTRARIWAWAPDVLRAKTYASLAETLQADAAAEKLDPAKAFPAPPGVDDRAANAPAEAAEAE